MTSGHMLTSYQVKAARVLLDWSQETLAQSAGLSIATIRKIEGASISPRQTTMTSIRDSLEKAGIEFLDADGVRRRCEEILAYRGAEGREAFFNKLYEKARNNGRDVIIIDSPDAILTRGVDAEDFFEQIEENTASLIKCLFTGSSQAPFAGAQIEYRLLSRHYVDPIPICLCDDIFAMITGEKENELKITSICSLGIALAMNKQFLSMWDKATPVVLENNKQASIRSA